MLSSSAWAQAGAPDSIASGRSMSSKHLSATGRTSEPDVRVSRLVGAQVNDRSGNGVGQVQDIILNPETGRIDFALLSLSGAAANSSPSTNLVPVPWTLLKTSAAQCADKSETPVFTLNTDPAKVTRAPTVDWSNPNQSQWRQRIYAYYGVTPPPTATPPPQPRTQ